MKPRKKTVEQQIRRQMKEKKRNWLSEIVGKWPGKETYEELKKLLRK